jgi:transposase-like protein
VVGTSTGGLLSLALVTPDEQVGAKYKASDLVNFYKQQGSKIFECSWIRKLYTGWGLWAPKYIRKNLSEHLKESKPNRRNGKTTKLLKSDYGAIELETSRDRNGSFEPQLVKKRQTTLGSALNDEIIALWAKGMSYSDISEHIEELYGMEVSEATLTSITDSIIPKVKEWQSRPLDAVYPIVWLDAICFKVRQEGRVINKAVYCVLAVNQQGTRNKLVA